ncbi:hypothetical protein LQW54_002290 [Pestalotiopsis sp. IQ-011]
MLRILSQKYEKVDVNYLSHRVAPLILSGLYIAAGSDGRTKTAAEFPISVVMTATMDYRAPVKLYSEEKWRELYRKTDGTMEDKGRIKDAEENHMSYLVLNLEKEDMEWWDKIELRKSDEELLAMETNGRECKSDIECIEKKSEP